jgi:hypothetical protein
LGYLIGCSARAFRCCGAFSPKSEKPRIVPVKRCSAFICFIRLWRIHFRLISSCNWVIDRPWKPVCLRLYAAINSSLACGDSRCTPVFLVLTRQ